MNLIHRIFKKKKDCRDNAFVTVANIIANTFEMSERQEMVNDLTDYLSTGKKELEGLNTGKIFCNCGNYTDPDNNLSFCDDCLVDQL